MEQVIDKLETLILMALDANHGHLAPGTTRRRDHSTNMVEVLHDQGELLRIDDMRPASAYTFDMSDDDRIFATTTDYLITHPADVLGDEAETVMLDGDMLKWRGYRRLKKPPLGVYCLGKASHWYEMHSRFVAGNGDGNYFKRVVPIDRNGKPLLAQVQGHNVCVPSIEGMMLTLCASMIEDAHRANTMLAAVKDATEIKFPVPLGDYKDMFAERQGPMNGTRRKAIIHWVAKHMRHSVRRKEYEVKRHTRGVQEFHIDGLRIRIAPNYAPDDGAGILPVVPMQAGRAR